MISGRRRDRHLGLHGRRGRGGEAVRGLPEVSGQLRPPPAREGRRHRPPLPSGSPGARDNRRGDGRPPVRDPGPEREPAPFGEGGAGEASGLRYPRASKYDGPVISRRQDDILKSGGCQAVKGAGLRTLSCRGSWVRIPSPAPIYFA